MLGVIEYNVNLYIHCPFMALYVGFVNHFIIALPILEIIQYAYCDLTRNAHAKCLQNGRCLWFCSLGRCSKQRSLRIKLLSLSTSIWDWWCLIYVWVPIPFSYGTRANSPLGLIWCLSRLFNVHVHCGAKVITWPVFKCPKWEAPVARM